MKLKDLIKNEKYRYQGSINVFEFRCFDEDGDPCFKANDNAIYETYAEENDNMNMLVHVSSEGSFIKELINA